MSSNIASRIAILSLPSSSRPLPQLRLSSPSAVPSIRPAFAVIAARIAAARAESALRRDVGRLLPEAFSTAGSRLPRARPSLMSSPEKHSFTFGFGGFAVPAATLESMRGRSPKPVIKSILKPSALSLIECSLCEASAEVYAAPWRSFPAWEWELDNLPINGLDRFAVQQIEKVTLLADGAQPRIVTFAGPIVTRRRLVSRWIKVRR